MKKNGIYTEINNNMYRISRNGNTLGLISRNKKDLDHGFKDIGDGFYKKVINKEDISHVFYLKTLTYYKGHRFLLLSENNEKNTCLLSGSFGEVELFPEMVQVDRDEFNMEVPRDEVEFIEEKSPYNLDDL